MGYEDLDRSYFVRIDLVRYVNLNDYLYIKKKFLNVLKQKIIGHY